MSYTPVIMNKDSSLSIGQKSMSSDEFDHDDNLVPSSFSPLSCFLGTLCFPAAIFSCFIVNPREEVVVLDYGKYNGTLRDEGCHYICCAGRTLKVVSTKVKSTQIAETKTIDKNGNPLIINGILSYQIKSSKKATLDVENADQFVITQGMAAMKQIVSRYPYELGDDHEGHCLKKSSDAIAHEVVAVLQERVRVAGVKILTFTFNEISYAPEIAAGMLKRQQAQAMLQARKVIVAGAVEIAQHTVNELVAAGIPMDDKSKVKIVGNLLTVICADSSVSPVLPLN